MSGIHKNRVDSTAHKGKNERGYYSKKNIGKSGQVYPKVSKLLGDETWGQKTLQMRKMEGREQIGKT